MKRNQVQSWPVVVVLVLLGSICVGNGFAVAGDPGQNLIDAAKRGDLAIVQLLLSKVADVNAKNDNGTTALIVASQAGHLNVVQALLAKGADVKAKRNDGVTALILASSEGHLDVVRMLLNKRADVNAKDNDGHTALILASQEDHHEVVQLLIAKGADGNVETAPIKDADLQALRKFHGKIDKLEKDLEAKSSEFGDNLAELSNLMLEDKNSPETREMLYKVTAYTFYVRKINSKMQAIQLPAIQNEDVRGQLKDALANAKRVFRIQVAKVGLLKNAPNDPLWLNKAKQLNEKADELTFDERLAFDAAYRFLGVKPETDPSIYAENDGTEAASNEDTPPPAPKHKKKAKAKPSSTQVPVFGTPPANPSTPQG